MTMPQQFAPQTGPAAGAQAPAWSPPNPLPWLGHEADDLGGDAIGWIASPVEKGVRDAFGYIVKIINVFLNTGFYVLVAVVGLLLFLRGLSTVMGASGSIVDLAKSGLALRGI